MKQRLWQFWRRSIRPTVIEDSSPNKLFYHPTDAYRQWKDFLAFYFRVVQPRVRKVYCDFSITDGGVKLALQDPRTGWWYQVVKEWPDLLNDIPPKKKYLRWLDKTGYLAYIEKRGYAKP